MSRIIRTLLCAAAAAACSCAASATPLSLAEAIERVLRGNAELRAAGHEVGAQDGALRQAGALPNPELSTLVEDRQRATRTTTIQLNQPIELGGKRAARVGAAELSRELARAELAAKRGELRAATRAAFIDLLAAQERQRLAADALALAGSALAAADKQVKAGKNSPLDATRARIAVAGAKGEAAQAAGETMAARAALAALWNGGADEVPAASGRLDELPAPQPLESLRQRLAQAPALQRARLEQQRRSALTEVERARRTPDLTVSVGSKRDEQLGRRQAVFGLALPLPLFDRNQGNLAEALARLEKARDELTATEARLGGELAQAHARASAAREQAQLLQRDALPDAQEAFGAARKGFEYGKFSVLDVLDAQRTLHQTQGAWLRALTDAQRAAGDIERLLGDDAPERP